MTDEPRNIRFLIHFDGQSYEASLEAVGDGWGSVEALAMRTGDNEMRCDRISITHQDSGEVRRYFRDFAGVWYRENTNPPTPPPPD